MVKKIQVSFSDKQIELLGKFKGELGETNADIVREIVISWLSEKGFISEVIMQKIKQKDNHDTPLKRN
jgi:hypothetical protein